MAQELEEVVEIDDTPQPSTSAAPQRPAPQQSVPPPAVMGCPGDCNRCTPIHRGYCASQIAYNMQNAVARLEGAVSALTQILVAVNEKISDMEVQLAEQRRKESQQPEYVAPTPTAKTKKGDKR